MSRAARTFRGRDNDGLQRCRWGWGLRLEGVVELLLFVHMSSSSELC
jgi:hypothetical protein